MLLSACTAGSAEQPRDERQRSVSTMVQDVLALMPIDDIDELNVEMASLAAAAPESVVMVADLMDKPVSLANSPMEYALSSLAVYASDPGNRSVRCAVVKGFRKAIKAEEDPYVKAFLQSQLRLVAPCSFRKSMMDQYETEVSEEAAQAYKMTMLAASDVFVLSEEEAAEGFQILFDGTNLNQWTGNKEGYVVDNGTIKVTAKYGNEMNLYTAKEYKDFIFRFEFFFEKPGVNNGVGVRGPHGVDAAYDAMCEVQILDHDAPIYADLREYQVHGSVYGVIPAKRITHKPLGQWSEEEIVVRGSHIKVTVNGEVIVDGDVREACKGHNVVAGGNNPYTVDHLNHPGLFNEKGYISFCGHGEGLRFRNIRIKEL